MRKSIFFLMSVLMVVSMVLSACTQPQPTPITIIQTVEVEKIVEGTPVTVIETVEVIVEVTPTPKPAEKAAADVLGLPRNETFIAGILTGRVGSPSNFNEWVGWKWRDRGMQNLANEPLWSVDFATGKIINGLAAGDPVYNEDFTRLEIPLREGVAWHDGTPFTAADVVFTIETLMKYEG